MFLIKPRRDVRHPEVLDELLDLKPAERRLRLAEAVLAGTVEASEAEYALRVAARLDALKTMSIYAA